MIFSYLGSHRQLWYSHGSHRSLTTILPMTLPWLICLRPWSVRPWVCYVGWLDPWRLHNRSRPRHSRWMLAQNNCCLVNLVVHRTKVFAQFEVLHEPIFGAKFAIFDVLRACIQGFVFWRSLHQGTVPSIGKSHVWRPWLWQRPYLQTNLVQSLRSLLFFDVQRFEGRSTILKCAVNVAHFVVVQHSSRKLVLDTSHKFPCTPSTFSHTTPHKFL